MTSITLDKFITYQEHELVAKKSKVASLKVQQQFKMSRIKPSMSLLFGALASKGRIKPAKNGSDYKLILNGVEEIKWFTDRPDRLEGEWKPQKLINKWDTYFESSEPNAQLGCMAEGSQEMVTFEMSKPKKRGKNKLIFNINGISPLGAEGLAELKGKKLTNASLFVDSASEDEAVSEAFQSYTPGTWGSKVFAPYVDMGAWPVPDLKQMVASANVDIKDMHFNAGFINSTTDGKAAWAGLQALEISIDSGQAGDIKNSLAEAQLAGAEVSISFGGQTGTSLAENYQQNQKTSTDLANTYQDVLDTFKVNRLDFDIESAAATSNIASINLRNDAIGLIQQKNPDVSIWLTLRVLPSGLPDSAHNIVKSAINADINIGGVNIMAMDYGSSFTGDMGDYANQAAQKTLDQITGLYKEAGSSETFGMENIGITPMIGVNDVPQNIFTVDDAGTVKDFSNTNDVGMISMWSLNNDNPSKTGLPGIPAYTFTQTWADYNS